MKKKTLLQILSLTFISVLVMFIFGIVAVNVNAKAMMKERLAEETELACSLVQTEEDFSAFARYSNNDAFRVTIIDLSGNVLFESDTKSPLENHIDREEVKNALNGKPQTVERYSETFGCNMTYYALKTELSDGTEIILRLAIKSSQINGYLRVALPILIVVLVVCLIASIVISNVLSNKISRKITEVGDSLRSLNEGNYIPIKTDSGEPELYSVLNEINELNANTHTHIQRVQEEHNKLNTVLENVSQGIVAIDEQKKIIFVNKSISTIFDSTENVTGKDFIYLIDDLPLCEKIARHLGENYVSEYTYKSKELSVVIRKVDSQSDNVYSIVIITDITKEKAMQKQKSDFFANASHELKTPVAVMQGLSELLLAKETLDEGSKKQVDRIHNESLRLASLISDMLKLSKLENGKDIDMVLSPVDVKAVADEVALELASELKKKNITLEVKGAGTVLADNKKIFELVENLCSNAIHYNVENGKITVEISEDKKETKITVADTGIGIEKENIPRLCERFYRVDKSRSKKTGGTGLGLAIVKHICALYNAELSIESEIGIGTTISIVFRK
ncbi:MAG: ATP-binding protein [Candidatus Enterosoma sp.]|nr:ATP-binding protein [bacterium]MDY5866244.1 ATP-binding protein [Candidatus Enterosoma sp.]